MGFVLILTFASLLSCNNESENQMTEVYNQLSLKGELFTISTKSDTTIICLKGTRVFIELNSFSTNSDSITIELKEVYKIGDMLLEGLLLWDIGDV